MPRYLILRLEAPLLAFGGEIVDAQGVIVDFPLTSTLTGMIANALGWERYEADKHAALQTRIRFAARIDRLGERIVDFQTAQLNKADKGWTRLGVEGRDGGSKSYDSPHIGYAHFHADRCVVVALELLDGDGPTLDDISVAISSPARPLFIGRKACLPSEYIVVGFVEADSVTEAITHGVEDPVPLMLPADEEAFDGDRVEPFSDLRDWSAGVHLGSRQVRYRKHFPEAVQ